MRPPCAALAPSRSCDAAPACPATCPAACTSPVSPFRPFPAAPLLQFSLNFTRVFPPSMAEIEIFNDIFHHASGAGCGDDGRGDDGRA